MRQEEPTFWGRLRLSIGICFYLKLGISISTFSARILPIWWMVPTVDYTEVKTAVNLRDSNTLTLSLVHRGSDILSV